VKVGLFLSAQHVPDADPRRALEEHVEQVRLARDHGFAAVFCGQHFLSEPFQMFQPVPLLARLAAEAGEMRVGAGILLAALLNPVEVAENVATLDAITDGRFVLGVGLGYRTEENEAFALAERRGDVYAAKLEVIRRLLEGETVTAAGLGYRLDGARLTLRPVQRPRPPIWMAANGDAGVRRAARFADSWLIGPHSTLAELERQVGLFRAERGSPPAELPAIREALLAPTDEEAIAAARPFLDRKYKAYVRWGQSDVLPEGDTLRHEWDELRRDRFLIGSPETAAAQLAEHRDRLGLTLLIVRVQWPGLPHAAAMRTLELLAREALPAATGSNPTLAEGA
jgi:alkanesulfonate monooxygenase SsuD/methylene tetrahydromethanopterin reductase-like flavin-dependent oxidoreductase (luciferase family)